MPGVLHYLGATRLIDTNGIADDANIYFFLTGTTTPAATYTDEALTTPHPHPIPVDSGARVPTIYLNDAITYRRRIVYADGSVDDDDPYTGIGSSGISFSEVEGTANRSIGAKLRDGPKSPYGYGAVGDGSDETAAVQAALDSSLASGLDEDIPVEVQVPLEIKFRGSDLTLPKRCRLIYFRDSNLDNFHPTVDVIGGEWVEQITGASDTGIVNEQRYRAPYHPGHVVEVTYSDPSQDAWLGAGQSRLNPVRASYNLLANESDQWRIVFQLVANGTYSAFSGTQSHGWRNLWTLTGVVSADWVTPLVRGAVVTGNTSGATGYFHSSDSSATYLLPYGSARFVVGERLTSGAQNPASTLSAVSHASTPLPWIGYGNVDGGPVVGVAQGLAIDAFTVGGAIVVGPTVSNGAYNHVSETKASIKFATALTSLTRDGFSIRQSTTKRPEIWDYEGTVQRASGMGPFSWCTFDPSSSPCPLSTSKHNVKSITKTATGRFQATFDDAAHAPRADYVVLYDLPTACKALVAVTTSKAVDGFEIQFYDYTGVTLTDPTGIPGFTVQGGDR